MSQRPNERCACGSGKKFKKCCISKGMQNLTDNEWHDRRLRRARLDAINEWGDPMMDAGMVGILSLFSPGMQHEMEDRRALEELQATVDSLEQGGTIDLDKLPPGVTVIRGGNVVRG